MITILRYIPFAVAAIYVGIMASFAFDDRIIGGVVSKIGAFLFLCILPLVAGYCMGSNDALSKGEKYDE